jgi:ABC-type molybdate transport system substrate-binding protein
VKRVKWGAAALLAALATWATAQDYPSRPVRITRRDRLHADRRDQRHAGAVLVGALPEVFELATVYSQAVSAKAGEPELARRFVEWIAGPQSRALRKQGGFEFTAEMSS